MAKYVTIDGAASIAPGRTLAAADNAVMLVDGAKGIEEQTRKLFAVARLRGLPIFTVSG